MPVEVQMPKIGLTMEEGTLVEWLKSPGDAVAQGQALFVLETEKITLEAESPASGVLGAILVHPGECVPTGTTLALILGAEEGAADSAPDSVPVPDIGQDAAPDADAAPRQPSKVKATPVARRLAADAGLDLAGIEGTGPGGRITAGDVKQAQATTEDHGDEGSAKTDRKTPPPRPPRRRVKASPRARQLAEEHGLDLARIEGTGREGRIMMADVERALAQAPSTAPRQTKSPATPQEETWTSVTPLTGTRGVIARRMAASAHTAAAVTTTTRADATELVRLREALSGEWQAEMGLKPSYNDFLLVILAKALAEFPYMNAHLADGEIRQQANIHIGLAVDTERGLIVPVIRGVGAMRLADVARIREDLVQRTRDGRLVPEDLQGGTFTLSNMGAFDVEASTPILNLPEVAILGVGRIAPRPAVVNGELCVRQTVTLSLTYDHRAIDGAPAARFLERVKHLIEEPYLALVR